jgi:hypothetical protein
MEIASTTGRRQRKRFFFEKKEPKNFDTFRLSLCGKAEAN